MRTNLFTRGVALAVLASTMTVPAFAEGKADRARAAIAEARGKIDTVNAMGAAGEVPRMVAEAQSALRSAEDDLKGGNKDEAIAAALHASEVADAAVGIAQKARNENAMAQQQQAQDADLSAQQRIADANDSAANAQMQADAANARAASAERAADAAAADAAAARAAQTTTVTTEQTKLASTSRVRKPVRTTVKRSTARPATVTEKTTTTVSTER